MKMRHVSLIGLLSIFSVSSVFSQVISLEVNTNGTPVIKLDGKVVKPGGFQNVTVTEATGLRFDLSGIQDKTTTIRIAEAVQNSKGDFSLDSNYFKVATTLSSDNKLKVQSGKKIVDVSQAFIVGLHSAKSDIAIESIFVPQLSSSSAPALSPGKTAGEAAGEDGNGGGKEEEEKQYQPGSAVYDALKLSDNSELSGEDLKIIVKYYYPDADVNDDAKAKALVDSTPFLKDLNITPLKADRNAAQGGGDILSSLSASAIGGLDVTAFADGLAKFLVKRTKQELSMAFFDKLKKIIDNTPDLTTLFPNTADHLSNIGEEIYDYERYVQNLREAFKKDITAIHYTLPGIINNHPGFFNDHRPLKIGINTGCYIARELEKRTHPGDILAAYPLEYLDAPGDITAIGAIKTIQLFSASLRDTTTSPDGNYWVSIGKLRELVNNRKALQIYFGLVYRESINRYERVQYGGDRDLATMLIQVSERYSKGQAVYDTCKRYILRLGDKVDALNKMIREYEKLEPDSSGLEKYAKYFRAAVDLVEYCTEVTKLPVINTRVTDIKPFVQKYFDIGYEVTDLVVDAYKKNYSAAINHVVKIYNMVQVNPLKKIVAEQEVRIELSKGSGEEASAKAALKIKLDSLGISITVVGRVIKYGSFLATLATAKNSDEVAKAIETAALPVGSSRIKREAPFNVSLNAYTGLFIGHESIRGVRSKRVFNSYGVTAPVGISISRGHSILFIGTGEAGWKDGKKGWSTSLFISLIDIGAVTAYRFKDSETAEVPTIQLKNIISPGAFISLGIPRTPLSFNIGAQMGPNLRKINSTTPGEEDNRRYWRFSTSFCVDIPLFNFYTKSRRAL